MKLTGSQIVMESLLKEGVEVIFGYPGGAIMPIYDALYDYQDKIRHILVRHEQGAAHAAEGYARMTNRAGICFATSGPGATNLVTGIMDAMMDSVPIVCITGQVSKEVLGTDAFQEADVIGIVTPITKWCQQVTQADEIAEVIKKAFYIAQSGRPGPVVVDITKNAQFEKTEFSYPSTIELKGYHPDPLLDSTLLKKAGEIINHAKRPYLLVGHGVLIAQAEKELQEFAEKADIPIASTLHGLSSFPTNHPLYMGMLGMHGNYATNKLINQADVLIAIGMRFDDRVTGRVRDFAPKAKIIHIDIDSAEKNKIVTPEIFIHADAKVALQELTKKITPQTHPEWVEKFKKLKKLEIEKVIVPEVQLKTGKITMAEVIVLLNEETKGKATLVADVGQHQMITARYAQFAQSNSFLTSGGSGTMGFALPAAIGAKVATPNREVIAIIGDGSFQMTIQELGTIVQEKLPVKIIILNNNFLGMVRQWQELFFEKRYSFTHLKNPDFVAVAKGFGIDARKIEYREDLESAIDYLLNSKNAYLLDISVEKEDNVFPMIPTGASVEEVRLE